MRKYVVNQPRFSAFRRGVQYLFTKMSHNWNDEQYQEFAAANGRSVD
jgi:hypothetical protein